MDVICFILILTLFTQHEYRSVKLLEMLMDEYKLWETFGLKESDRDNDRNFLEALITFDKKCEKDGEKKLLDVRVQIVHICFILQLDNYNLHWLQIGLG